MGKEIWKEIKGYSHYEVSSNGIIRTKSSKEEVNVWYFSGYKKVTLIGDNGLKGQLTVHREVAKAFIPNPWNKPQVNHINGVRDDNRTENLEWVTARENLLHARHYLPRKKIVMKAKKGSDSPRAVPVVQYSKFGKFIAEFGSITEAASTLNIHMGDISSCCSGRRKTAGGFIWKYKK